jgi:fused signal recognition particle receptor
MSGSQGRPAPLPKLGQDPGGPEPDSTRVASPYGRGAQPLDLVEAGDGRIERTVPDGPALAKVRWERSLAARSGPTLLYTPTPIGVLTPLAPEATVATKPAPASTAAPAVPASPAVVVSPALMSSLDEMSVVETVARVAAVPAAPAVTRASPANTTASRRKAPQRTTHSTERVLALVLLVTALLLAAVIGFGGAAGPMVVR